LIVEATYLLFWLCLWCFFAIKQEWDFQITLPGSFYRPNMTPIVNPPPPRNLFDQYQGEKTVYQPESYASIRRPLRPAGLVFAESNDYSGFDAYGKMGTLRSSPNNYQ
jgi:hypothetical protein